MFRSLTMIVAAATLVAVTGVAVAVKADENPIEARQKIMKGNGAAAKQGADMVKGAAPFDLAKAQGIFDTFSSAAAKMPELFPVTSQTGNDTTASPKIWENMADFKASFSKFGKDAQDAKGTVTDLKSFETAFRAVAKDCGSCHDTYRVKKG